MWSLDYVDLKFDAIMGDVLVPCWFGQPSGNPWSFKLKWDGEEIGDLRYYPSIGWRGTIKPEYGLTQPDIDLVGQMALDALGYRG